MLPINKIDHKFVPKNLRANCLNLSKRLVAIVVILVQLSLNNINVPAYSRTANWDM